MKNYMRVMTVLFPFFLFGSLCNVVLADEVADISTAIFQNDIETVRKILDGGLDPNLKGEGQSEGSLMNLACSKNHMEIVKLLLSKGADVNLPGMGGYTPLMWAAKEGKTPELVNLLIAKGANVKAVTDDGNSVLDNAVFGVVSDSTSMETLKILVDKGADVKHVRNQGPTAGYTTLMVAARWNKPELAQYLISKGVDVNAKAKNGDTALSIAKSKDYGEIVSLLQKHGAKE